MAAQNSGTKFLVVFLGVLLAGNVVWLKFMPKGRPYMGNLIYGVYFRGNVIENKLADAANSEEQCSDACMQDARCKAMSFVVHPWGGGICQLKDQVSVRMPASDAISAVKHIPWSFLNKTGQEHASDK